MPSLKERLTAAAYIAGWKLTAALPSALSIRLFQWGADIASKNGTGPQQLRDNLARVVGSDNVTDELVRDSMRSYLRYWREAFRLPRIAGPELAAVVDTGFVGDSREVVANALARDRGTILVLPHMGNWDMAGMWLVTYFDHFSTVAERLKPAELFDAFVEYRESLGFRIIAHEGADVAPFSQLVKVLEAGGIVCLMGDRDLTAQGVPVTFFGETAFMPCGAALLAQRTGASLVTVGLGYAGGNGQPETWRQHAREITDLDRPVEQIVQEQADNFADFIARYPQDWHMLQPLWARDLSQSRLDRLGFDLATSPNPADRGEESN